MVERQVVLIDMDGVLADFDREVAVRLASRHPEVPIMQARKNFYIAEDYPEHYDIVKGLSREKDFFNALPIVEGALEGWQRIIDTGRQPRICSSPISSNPHSRVEKLEWLEHHFAPIFGMYVVDEAIITPDKHLFGGVALIDDRPEVKEADTAVWEHIVFDRPYNQADGQLRLYGWKDPNLPQLLDSIQV